MYLFVFIYYICIYINKKHLFSKQLFAINRLTSKNKRQPSKNTKTFLNANFVRTRPLVCTF